MSELTVTKPKVPMGHAVKLLAELCDRLDNGEEPSRAVVEVFNETRLELAEAVDRRIMFDVWIESAINTANSVRDQWGERSRKLRAAREAFKENTQAIMESAPDLPYQGSMGKFAIQRNSQPALKLSFGDKELTTELIEFFCIDPRFVKTVTSYVLDSAAVKAALQAGETIDWAELEHNSHLRIKKT